ncbi:hypothetical protein [Lacibacter sp. H407]|uniref:hypothetical protein n=1 Tax=Lacibacter sp. H407 TaxID=3133423 RepID=UPI0030C18547
MKQLLLFGFLFCSAQLFAQKYSGQWSGSFDATGEPGNRTEYFLELEISGTNVEGTSTTYFMIEGKRYYTICKVVGTLDPNSKTIVSKEVARIKANTPQWFKDCFQEHVLTYYKKGDTEELEGRWKGASAEDKCGTGTTVLSRKQLVKNMITKTPPQNNTVRMNPAPNKPATQKPTTTNTQKPNSNNQNNSTAKTQPKKEEPVKNQPTITKVENEKEPDTKTEIKPTIPAPKLPGRLEKRESKVFETIAIDEEEITVNLYDNAEIDGDIITVLFNGELVASQKTLSDKPITIKLKAIRGRDNTLTMYAENQGRVPPNTAIMRVQNGEQYYKVFLSADDKKNGSVVFRFKS